MTCVALLAVGGASLFGCAGGALSTNEGPIRVLSPERDAVLAQRSIEIVGEIEDPTVTEVLVDGMPVAVSGGMFSAQVRRDEGPARVQIELDGLVLEWPFTIDLTRPKLVIESPAPSTHLRGRKARITGRVEDANIDRIELDGETIAVGANGAFAHEMMVEPGAHRFRLLAFDRAGHSDARGVAFIAGEYAPHGMPLDDGLVLSVGADAIDAIAEGAKRYLLEQDINALVQAENPVADGSWGEANVKSVSYRDVDVRILPRAGAVELFVDIGGLDVVVDVDHPLGDNDVRLQADPASFSAILAVTERAGALETELRFPIAKLERFDLDVDGIPSGLVDIVEGQVRRELENAIRDAIIDVVPSYVQEALGFVTGANTIDLADTQLTFTSGIHEFEVDAAGIRVVLDVSVQPAVADLSLMSVAPGSVLVEDWERPDLDVNGYLLGVRVDLINAALSAAWLGGVARTRLVPDGFTVGSVGLLFPKAEVDDSIPRDAPIVLRILPRLPPVVRRVDDGLEVMAADVYFEVLARVGVDEVPLASMSAAIRAPARLHLDSSELKLTLGEITMVVDPVEVPEGVPIGKELDEHLWSSFGTIITETLTLDAFAIPSIGVQIETRGPEEQQGFLVMEGAISAP